MNSVGHADGEQRRDSAIDSRKDERKNNGDSVQRGFQWTCFKHHLTFKRMLSVRLPALPPAVVFGGEFVVLV